MENDQAQTAPMNRQQICAALSISESTIRRLEHAGLPYTPVGIRSKRYDLAECKAWLRSHYGAPGAAPLLRPLKEKWDGEKKFIESCERAQRRMTAGPSK
jgi:hypothetical protein